MTYRDEVSHSSLEKRERPELLMEIVEDGPLKGTTSVRRVLFLMKGGVEYKNRPQAVIPVDMGVRP